MEEIIIVAGTDKTDVCRLRRYLREHGYHSIPCRSAEQIIEEIHVLAKCDASVPLVVIDRNILRDLDDVSVNRLADCTPHVPILQFGKLSAPDDLHDVFEKICEYRIRFRSEQNPALADVLQNAGVQIAYS